MKKLTLTLSVILFCAFSLVAEPEKPVTIKNLPQISQQFLSTHFSNLTFSSGVQEGLNNVEYTIKYTDGTEVEFDAKGQWKEVKSRISVPDAIIPAKILQYVKVKYSNAEIVKIEKDRNGFEIELSNDIDLVFNTDGDFVKVD